MVLDCADGAASDAGPRALRDAGAEVIAIDAEPDGLNINDGCGSTHLGAAAGGRRRARRRRRLRPRRRRRPLPGRRPRGQRRRRRPAAGGAGAGDARVRHAGQGHRRGDGDEQPRLRAGDARPTGVGVRQTKVGDRYVLEAMKVSGYSLGGEQSGHVIMSDHATTGDGILTALHVLERMAATGQSLQTLAVGDDPPARRCWSTCPDVDKSRADEDAVLAAAVAEEEAVLGDSGRVLLRPSGTEPLVRVMVEAPTADAGPGRRRPAGATWCAAQLSLT